MIYWETERHGEQKLESCSFFFFFSFAIDKKIEIFSKQRKSKLYKNKFQVFLKKKQMCNHK